MIVSVNVIHEERNQEGFQEIGIEPEIIQYIEEGFLDLKQVVAMCAYHENTQVFLQGGHSLIIEEELYKFVALWKKTQ